MLVASPRATLYRRLNGRGEGAAKGQIGRNWVRRGEMPSAIFPTPPFGEGTNFRKGYEGIGETW